MTVGELCDEWLEYRRGEVREVTREEYAHALKPVRRHLGARKVRTIGHADVVALRRWLSESGSVSGRPLGSHASRASLTTGTMATLRRLKVANMANPTDNPGALVVVDALGLSVLPRTFTKRFQSLARAAGLPVIRLHSTRQTVAYLLHDAGMPPVKAATYLGHTLAVHLSVYLFARDE